MLESVKIQRRQSEIRQALSELVGKPQPTEDETRRMSDLDAEYRVNEVRYRAALVAEDTERRNAGRDLDTRPGRQWDELVQGYELRQVALALDTGRALDGRTAEVVQELRSRGNYRGIPLPWAALESRNTVSTNTPDPIQTRPIIDRLFPDSVAARMGVQMIQIDSGAVEYPVTTSSVTAGWAASEGGNVATAAAYATTDRALKPDHTLGVQSRISRKALQQSGDALEQAIRRDVAGAMAQELDRATFLGTGADGQPLGLIAGAATYGIGVTAVDAAASWGAVRAAVAAFMAANAAASPDAVRLLIRPELWSFLDGALITGTAVSEWDRLTRQIPPANIATTSNALAAPAGSPSAVTAFLSTATGGVAPAFMGMWGAIDMVRDPYPDAQAGGLRLTALATVDLTVARPAQSRVLTGLELA